MESHSGTSETALRDLLGDVLALSPERTAAIVQSSPLFGALPELDSMAVAGVLTEIEDRFHIVIDDDEVDGALFETFGALAAFVDHKINRQVRT